MRKAINQTYRIITGRNLDLRQLEQEERPFIAHLLESFKHGVEWSKFATLWMLELERRGLNPEGMAHRVCQDLEARLGIAQGKVPPPDYRNYLAELIDEKYGSRFKFCKETGVDPGHLSRVFASRSDLSLEALTKLLDALGAALIIQPEDVLKAQTSPEEASRALAGVA